MQFWNSPFWECFRWIVTPREQIASAKLSIRAIRFAALAHIVGWVQWDTGTFFVGFAYLNVAQQFEIATKLANPTKSVADHRLNPTYDSSSYKTFQGGTRIRVTIDDDSHPG